MNPKLVVMETPIADAILEGKDVTLSQMKKALTHSLIPGGSPTKDQAEDSLAASLDISGEDARKLLHIAIHFASKAIIGSPYYQEGGVVYKDGDETPIVPDPSSLSK